MNMFEHTPRVEKLSTKQTELIKEAAALLNSDPTKDDLSILADKMVAEIPETTKNDPLFSVTSENDPFKQVFDKVTLALIKHPTFLEKKIGAVLELEDDDIRLAA